MIYCLSWLVATTRDTLALIAAAVAFFLTHKMVHLKDLSIPSHFLWSINEIFCINPTMQIKRRHSILYYTFNHSSHRPARFQYWTKENHFFRCCCWSDKEKKLKNLVMTLKILKGREGGLSSSTSYVHFLWQIWPRKCMCYTRGGHIQVISLCVYRKFGLLCFFLDDVSNACFEFCKV